MVQPATRSATALAGTSWSHSPGRRGAFLAPVQSAFALLSEHCARGFIATDTSSCRLRPERGVLKRMNSAFIRHRLSRKKRDHVRWITIFPGKFQAVFGEFGEPRAAGRR